MTQPRIDLKTHVHPLALMRDDTECTATVRLDIQAPGDVPVRPLNLGLVIDRSGSMAGEKIAKARAAAARVVEKLSDQDTVTVVAFNDSADTVIPATRLGEGRARALSAIPQIEAGSGTMISLGLQAAVRELTPHLRSERLTAVFVLTDGQTGDAQETLRLGGQLPTQGIQLYAAGIGGDYAHEFLGQLCGKNRVDHIDSPDQMDRMFEQFLQVEGRLVSANGRLSATLPAGVRIESVTA